MIELFMSTTPNGLKPAIFLEETGIPHRIVRLSLSRGEQHAPAFQAISPNGKIPAIVDHAPADGGPPLPVFESGAILLYLAEKHGAFLPATARERLELMQWLFWQVGGLGPMGGQIGHFNWHAPERVPYAIARYERETRRLFGVLDRRLAGRAYIAGAYSIADMAAFPWIAPHAAFGIDLSDFPNLARWFDVVAARPAVQRAYDGVEPTYGADAQPLSAAARAALFQQNAT